MQLIENSVETRPGPGEWFTGAVYIDTVTTPSGRSRLQVHRWLRRERQPARRQ